jgi:hypothetical protein
MQVADGSDTIESVLERGEGRRLGEEHEQPVETLVEVRVSFGFEKLYA